MMGQDLGAQASETNLDQTNHIAEISQIWDPKRNRSNAKPKKFQRNVSTMVSKGVSNEHHSQKWSVWSVTSATSRRKISKAHSSPSSFPSAGSTANPTAWAAGSSKQLRSVANKRCLPLSKFDGRKLGATVYTFGVSIGNQEFNGFCPTDGNGFH